VRPLEIWDLLTGAGPLHRCRGLPGYPLLLAEALEALRAGTAVRPSGEIVHVPFEALVLAGGGLLEVGVQSTLQVRFHGSLFFPDPVFAAAPGGRAILSQMGKSGLVADVGQTALKVFQGNDRFLYHRDWRALPPAEEVTAGERERQRLALRSFVASGLRGHAEPRPESVVLALPCDFTGGAPGACSYAGLEGDADFVEEVLAQAGLGGVPCLVLNDAVLAALSARELFARQLPARTLVVTLGYGVGAALLEGGGRNAL
jgi:hypothetical protein